VLGGCSVGVRLWMDGWMQALRLIRIRVCKNTNSPERGLPRSRMQLVCSLACTPTSPTKTSTSSEPAWAK
jgi:hypothetical protein